MPIKVDFADEHIELGPSGREDKELSFTAEDADGNASVIDAVTLEIESPSGVVTKTEDDFSRDGYEWVYEVRFDEAGIWSLSLSATDEYGSTENISFDRLLVRE